MSTVTTFFLPNKTCYFSADILHYVKNTLIIKLNKRRKIFFYKVIVFIKFSNIMFLDGNSCWILLKKK